MQARFDKHGRRLPDTGRGCGCGQCADSNAAPYERRAGGRAVGIWSPLRRRLALMLRSLTATRREAA